jgi:hypothetical protein
MATVAVAVSTSMAQTISPSNSSQDLYPAATSPRFLLNGNEYPDIPAIQLAPLGQYAEMSHHDFAETDVVGRLLLIDEGNANDDFPNAPRNFFYLSCDPEDYTGNLNANQVFDIAANNDDVYILILFSRTSDHCTATGLHDIPSLGSILTTTDTMVATELAGKTLTPDAPGTFQLIPDLNSYTNSSDTGSGREWGSGGGPNGSPTTAVAMIILYSITGVITALFISIIITGAIRAHRHPERYGPRAILTGGRGRQSRARGIARAMLDTLPIVKFGDRDNNNNNNPDADGTSANAVDAQKSGDIEMTAGSNTTRTEGNNKTEPHQTAGTTDVSEAQRSAITTTAATPETATEPTPAPTSSNAAAAPTNANTNTTTPAPENAPSCSICTEDFTLGSDVRVLPCNHRFHPECVDPWLLNVSGTCPLCRIDLRPKTSDTDDADAAADSSEDPEVVAAATTTTTTTTRERVNSITTAGFRVGEDTIGAFSLRSGRSHRAPRPVAGANAAHEGGSFAGLRRALAGSREERISALRRYREARLAGEGEGDGGGEVERGAGRDDVTDSVNSRGGVARRALDRLRGRPSRRDPAVQGDAAGDRGGEGAGGGNGEGNAASSSAA